MELGLGSGMQQMVAGSSQQREAALVQELANRAGATEEDRARLTQVAKQFEGVFLNTLLKAMRSTVPENDLFNTGGPTKFYQQMQDAETAKALAEGHSGLGIAQLIIGQFAEAVEREDTKLEPMVGPAPLGPPAPRALEQYRLAGEAAPRRAGRMRLRALAEHQGGAVADTLRTHEHRLQAAAKDQDVDAALLLAVIMEESGGNEQAVSHKGATGLMQLMPATAREVGVLDPENPTQNIQGGARYLRRMLDRYDGRLDLALAAYNAGPGAVDRAGRSIPPYAETQGYVDRVMTRYQGLGGGTEIATGDWKQR